MRISKLLLSSLAIISSSVFALEADIQSRQQQWAGHHIIADKGIKTAHSTLDPLSEFSKLHLNTLPHPEIYHLYIRDQGGNTYCLKKEATSQTTRLIRLYGNGVNHIPNYVTISNLSPESPKEVLVNPSLTTYSKKEPHPTDSSSSYPTGVRTYYIRINGKNIRLDQGHGIPHADTLVHPGLISTRDPENYVPQNIKYNSPIRRDLEDELHKRKLSYKEISIYHQDKMYYVTDVNGKQFANPIPIPEGFLLLTFTENNEIQDTYYFPNLVDYEQFKTDRTPYYAHIPARYRVSHLSQWFLIPEVTLGLAEEQQEKVILAESLAQRILLCAPTFFGNFTEREMPPKARVALLTTLLGWNIETAASLEFLNFSSQLKLVHFYLPSRRNYWELDSRTEAEKQLSLASFLRDQTASYASRTLVTFLSSHLSFTDMQAKLQEIVNKFEEINKNAEFYWEVPLLYPEITTLTASNGDVYEYKIVDIQPTDILKLKMLVGGITSHNEQKARYILSIIDTKARRTSTSIMEKLGLMRLYHDEQELADEERHLYWEKVVLEQINSGVDGLCGVNV